MKQRKADRSDFKGKTIHDAVVDSDGVWRFNFTDGTVLEVLAFASKDILSSKEGFLAVNVVKEPEVTGRMPSFGGYR